MQVSARCYINPAMARTRSAHRIPGIAILLAAGLLAVAPEQCAAVRIRMCAGQQYDRTQQTCCDGNLVDRFDRRRYGDTVDVRACCGRIAFDPTEYICCKGKGLTRRESSNDGCCGLIGFNPSYQACCGGTVRTGDACCGPFQYRTAIQRCCSNGNVAYLDRPCS